MQGILLHERNDYTKVIQTNDLLFREGFTSERFENEGFLDENL